MSALAAFGLITGVATFVGIGVAVYYGRKEGQKRKLLVYSAGVVPIPLASSRSLAEYKLLLQYQPTEGVTERIENAFVHYLRFANFGREPIRRGDLAPANPLRIEVTGARVLDMTVQAVHRDVSRMELESIEAHDDVSTARVTFDFLDYLDGALVRVMTSDRPSRLELVGDIIGMPGGIRQPSDLQGGRKWLNRAGTALALLVELSALALTPFVYRWVTGSWEDVWLLALPLIAIVLPLVLTAVVAATIWPKDRITFPKELHPRGFPFFGPYGSRILLPAVGDGDIVEMHLAVSDFNQQS